MQQIGSDPSNSRHAVNIAATQMTDAVEKRFLAPARRRGFQKGAHIENIDSSILDFGFYYYPFPQVERALADFFDSIDPKPT
jgi:hypothetical protein